LELIVHDDFIKEVKKIPKEIRKRVKEKLLLIEKEPFMEIQKLGGFNLYKTRIGKYRILLIVDFKNSLIFPATIDLRKKAYKNLTKKKEKEIITKFDKITKN
jgi:mRNA-degrading endonuclease RelE of RelBE toxin-antitoxin system